MKQFAQCTNCHQWYTRSVTASVEIDQGEYGHCIAIWCFGCIQKAEQRSLDYSALSRLQASLPPQAPSEEGALPETLQQFMEEHLHLMDRALYDEEHVLVPIIQDFIERANLSQTQHEPSAQLQRLLGHVHYWETFLHTLQTHG